MIPPLSILDLCPIVEGGDARGAFARGAFARSVSLAQRAEALGFRRFWLAEQHNMPGIASAATSLVIAHVAAATRTIRVGAGGIMLPNHAPLIIAEQFGTLATLHPGRIDLGLGRAPGTDRTTAHALRRNLAGDVDQFPRDVLELLQYFRPEPARVRRAHEGRRAHRDRADLGRRRAPALARPHRARRRRVGRGARSSGTEKQSEFRRPKAEDV